MQTDQIYNYLMKSAYAALELQKTDGSFPPGHNNKWQDIDTPVRATSHFLIQLLFAYKHTNEQKFLKAAENAGDYLLSNCARPGGQAFLCRISSKKSLSNGLIGQAWAIEALSFLGSVSNNTNYTKTAYFVFKLHNYAKDYGLFHAIDCDGSDLGVSKTMNHQLIFAATGLSLIQHGYFDLSETLEHFFLKLPENMSLTKDGLINHYVRKGRSPVERFTFDLIRSIQRRNMSDMSTGYHSFNLFALALAKRHSPNMSFWTLKKLKQLITRIHHFTNTEQYLKNIFENEFALAFRLTGQEILFFKTEFGYSINNQNINKIIDLQFSKHWDNEKNLLRKNTADPETLSSRLYEMWYLYDSLNCVQESNSDA